MKPPLISICIPSYKRVQFLKRLMDSIEAQVFQDYEVVVTDDSPGNEVAELCKSYSERFVLHYFRNPQPLGTPENWNQAIRLAKGVWIKLMHDDDWLAGSNSLLEFATAIESHPGIDFFYSAYRNVYEDSGKEELVFVAKGLRNLLQKKPVILFGKNLIGPPSVVLYRNMQLFWYDPTVKWVVDIEFYIRYLNQCKAEYIPQVLVNVGLHREQVTTSTFRNPKVEIPENFYLLNKVGIPALRNLRVYDAWWRLMRNLRIVQVQQIRNAGYAGKVPNAVESMIHWQKRISPGLLNIGIFSKMCMLANYLYNLPIK